MGTVGSPDPSKLIIAVMATNESVMATGHRMLAETFGTIDAESDVYPFTFTDYYQSEMGDGLVKQFVGIENLMVPDALPSIKHITNEMEMKVPRTDGLPGRALNLDPGYINGAQLILASTKNYSHRIYIDRGIYAELTLMFHKGEFKTLPWTYPDYKTDLAFSFFSAVRKQFLTQR